MPPGDPRIPRPAGDRAPETIVGHVPWKDAATANPPPAARPGPSTPRERPRRTPPTPRRTATAGASVATHLGAILRASPAWTTSLAVHTLLLVALALWIVRLPEKASFALVLGFGPDDGTPGSVANDDAIVEMPGEEADPTEEVPNEPTEALAEQTPPDPAEETTEQAPVAEATRPAANAIRVALSGRDPGRRADYIGAGGGSEATEAAVAAALEWIVRQQRKDGLWSLQGPYGDGGSQENRLAATAMALLALQGAGNTHRTGEHRAAVARGWKKLLSTQLPDGVFDTGPLPSLHQSYSHAQAAIALCELYGMSDDPDLRAPAERAIAYAVGAQGPSGGWRYEPRREGDMSVTGWYVMALESALMADLDVPRETFERVSEFLDSVAIDEGRRYGYRSEIQGRKAKPVTAAVTAEGLLARQYLGWQRDDPRIVEGLAAVMREKPIDFDADKDVYAWYYITQVAHHAQGPAWRSWNARMRAELPAQQVPSGREKGSWDPSLDRWSSPGGRLFVTCFCTWMLEVYYRHLPLYGEIAPEGEMGTAAADGEAVSR